MPVKSIHNNAHTSQCQFVSATLVAHEGPPSPRSHKLTGAVQAKGNGPRSGNKTDCCVGGKRLCGLMSGWALMGNRKIFCAPLETAIWREEGNTICTLEHWKSFKVNTFMPPHTVCPLCGVEDGECVVSGYKMVSDVFWLGPVLQFMDHFVTAACDWARRWVFTWIGRNERENRRYRRVQRQNV